MAGNERSYPTANPFPVQATASVEGSGRSGSVMASVQTPQLKLASAELRGYLSARHESAPSPGVLAFFGPPGSGKTHTLRFLLEDAKSANENTRRTAGQVYVLSGGADLSAVRYGILKEIPLETLRAVSARFVEVIGLEQVDAAPRPETAAGRAQRAKLRGNLAQVGELIKSALIDPEEVGKRQSEELREAGSDDLRNALVYLEDEKLGPSAYAWLCGDTVDDETRLRLGVGKERDRDHAHRALRVVLRLFWRTRTPLVILLDQCEAFLKSALDETLNPDGVRFFQNLVEMLPKEHAFLAVAMSEEVWRLLPDYLRQRFGARTYQFSVLSLSDAKEFIHTYVHRRPLGDGSADIFPFDDEAVKEILAGERGNLRGFLQTCHEAFELAFPDRERITPDLVRRALVAAKRERPSLEAVTARVEGLLRDYGLELSIADPTREPWQRYGRIRRLMKNRAGTPIAVMELTESLFIDDEAGQGVTTVEAVTRALQEPLKLPVIVVVVGYASPEIVDRLIAATPHVLVYEPDGFRRRLGEVIESVREGASKGAGVGVTASELAQLRDELVKLFQSRSLEAERTSETALGVLRRQEEVRIQEAWRNARTEWSKERKQVEEQIRAGRAARLTAELATMEWERRRAAKDRNIKLAIAWSVVGAALVVLMALVLYTQLSWESIVARFSAALFIPLGVAAFGFLIHIFAFAGPARALWGKVRSIEELDDLAAKVMRRSVPTTRLLTSENPQLRYAAVRRMTSDLSRQIGLRETSLERTLFRLRGGVRPYDSEFTSAQGAESNQTVRRAMVALVSRHGGVVMHDWPERVYAFDGEGVNAVLEGMVSAPSLELVGWIQARPSPVRDAYDRGISLENWPELARRSSVPRLQGLLRELSPLERPGIGTFDYLREIAAVDDLYLFARQWMYFIELDLPVAPP